MVGSALASLELPAARLASEFILAMPTPAGAATLDERCDVAQLALIAVSLMAGRRIALEDYPDTLREVLDEIARRHHGPGPVRFEVFVIGSNAHCRSTTGRSIRRRTPRSRLRGCRMSPNGAGTMRERPCRRSRRKLPTRRTDAADVVGCPASPRAADPSRRALGAGTPGHPRARSCRACVARRSANVDSLGHRVCVVALAEAAIIAGCCSLARPPPPPSMPRRPFRRRSWRSCRSAAAPGGADRRHDRNGRSSAPEIRAVAPPAAPVRTGAFRVSAPIELHVLDGERVVGSSVDGPLSPRRQA